ATEPLLVEARIKDGPKREYETRTIDRIDRFDASCREPLDAYGGWKTARYEATGFFYPKKIGDRWWLIDPEGYRFLHVAVNSVSPGDSPTNRETLPRRFGTLENWRDETITLLRSYGFNGTGNWSDDELLRTGKPGLVQTRRLNFMGGYGRETGRVVQEPGHLGYPNRCIFVFDPQFEKYADKIASQAAAWKDDRYVLGYFSDNELPFPADLLDRYLSLDASDPGHQAARRWLSERGVELERIDGGLREEFRGFVVDRYLDICKRAIRKYDPNHLFLGPRFHSSEKRSEAVFHAAGKHLDVIAVNLYGQWSPDQAMLRQWNAWSGRPVIITEWYAKGDDSGMENLTGAGWTVATQRDRGSFYQNFTLGLLESQVCVGWHWFKYMDNDPRDLSTDPSNRNSNKGIVTAAYEPWQPLLDSMKQLNECVYPLTEWLDNRPG
ncbi:MAG: agarase, partial [Planctomycetes bacterium]|nr:agarase [Planctomycetota bacterium]